MISQRTQTLLLFAFLVVVAAIIAVMVVAHDPQPVTPPAPLRTDVDSASKRPAGPVRFLAGPDGVILRLRTGSCEGAGQPSVELSHDGGWRFRDLRLPQVDDGTGVSVMSPDITAVVAADATSRRELVLLGADDACRVRSYRTADAGATWIQGDLPATGWWIDPKTGDANSPDGPAKPPCDRVASVTGFRDGAVATCADGSVHISEEGDGWDSAPDLDDATTAVFFTSTSSGFALVDEDECRSRVIETEDAGETWTDRGCVVDDRRIRSIGGSSDLLVAGGAKQVWVSTDGGQEWQEPSKPGEEAELPADHAGTDGDTGGLVNEDE